MKLEVVAFKQDHLKGFEPRVSQENLGSWLTDRSREELSVMGTFFSPPHVLGFVGYHCRNENTAEVWVVLAKDLHGQSLSLVRTVRRMIQKCFDSGFGRVQALCNADRPDICKWLEVLGFEREGLLRSYGPHGEDRFMYGRVRCSHS